MQLKAYLMTLPDIEAREAFAQRCGTTLAHMRNVAYRQKPCGVELAVAIEQQSGGAVTRKTLCPDNWARIWPELIAA